MIIGFKVYNGRLYTITKVPFGWYRVYEHKELHSKFKYGASAVDFVAKKNRESGWY